jgi:hypothetical protein
MMPLPLPADSTVCAGSTAAATYGIKSLILTEEKL